MGRNFPSLFVCKNADNEDESMEILLYTLESAESIQVPSTPIAF